MNRDKISESYIGREFLEYLDEGKEQPSVDKLLDWRNVLAKNYSKKYPYYTEIEIKGVDMILSFLNTENTKQVTNAAAPH